MTRDEAFQEYEKAIALIDKNAREASEQARATLLAQLKCFRDEAHAELKTIRALSQKTKRSK